MPGPGGPGGGRGPGRHGGFGGPGGHHGPGGHCGRPMGGYHGHRPPPPPPMGGGYRRPYRGGCGCGCCGPMMVMVVGTIVGILALIF